MPEVVWAVQGQESELKTDRGQRQFWEPWTKPSVETITESLTSAARSSENDLYMFSVFYKHQDTFLN